METAVIYLGFILLVSELYHKAESSILDCTFDHDFCHWTNVKSDCFDWAIGNGETVDKTSGPAYDHTTGKENGSYAVIYGRRSVNSTCTALLSSQNAGTNTDATLSFWYHMNGNGIGKLTVYIVSGNHRQQVWQRKGRQSPDWLQATIPVKAGDFRVEFEANAKFHYGSDLAIDDIYLQKAGSATHMTSPGPTKANVLASMPLSCNFDQGLCSLYLDNSNDSMVAWRRYSGSETFQNQIFIQGDNTTGHGSYLSLYVKSGQLASIGDRTKLYFPAVKVSKMSCLSFAYNLPSKTSGAIEVFQRDESTNSNKLLAEVSGYKGNKWNKLEVQLFPSPDILRIVIEGFYSGEPGCIVAIDDISLKEERCTQFTTTTTTTPPTTPTLPALSFKSVTSCQPEFNSQVQSMSCDFASDFCNYTNLNRTLNWYRIKHDDSWLYNIPDRSDKGYYLAFNLSDWNIRNGDGVIASPETEIDNVCIEFWYSMTATTSNIKVQIMTFGGRSVDVWTKTSRVNNGAWTKQSIVISSGYKFKLLFYSNKTSAHAKGAVDDIKVFMRRPTLPSSSLPTTLSTVESMTRESTIQKSTEQAIIKTTTHNLPSTTQYLDLTTVVESTKIISTQKERTKSPTTEGASSSLPTTEFTTKTKPTTNYSPSKSTSTVPSPTEILKSTESVSEKVSRNTSSVTKIQTTMSRETPTKHNTTKQALLTTGNSIVQTTKQPSTILTTHPTQISTTTITPNTMVTSVKTKATDSTKKPKTTEKPTDGKTEASKSDGLSDGSKLGIGLSVSLLFICVIVVIFIIWKKKSGLVNSEFDAIEIKMNGEAAKAHQNIHRPMAHQNIHRPMVNGLNDLDTHM